MLVSGIQHSDSDIYVYVCVYYINGASLLAETVKNPRAMQETWVWSLGQEDPLEEEILPGESHGQRSLVGYSPWGHKELDMTD